MPSMRLSFSLWALPFVLVGSMPTGAEPIIYVANEGGSVNVFDVGSGTATAGTTLIGPEALVVSPDGRYLYVVGNRTFSVISLSSHAVVGSAALGGNAKAIVQSPDGERAYLPRIDGVLSIVDTALPPTVIANVTVGSDMEGIAISADGRVLYVTDRSKHTLSRIDALTYSITDTISGFSDPIGIALSHDGSSAYVADFGGSHLSVVNLSTHAITNIATTNPNRVAVAPDGSKVYVSNPNTQQVSRIDPVTHVVDGLTVGPAYCNPRGVTVSHDGKSLYVAEYPLSLSVIDTVSWKETHLFKPEGIYPIAVAVPAPPLTDAGTPDAGHDGGVHDAGTPDGGNDGGTPDSGVLDSGIPDSGNPDTDQDAGNPPPVDSVGSSQRTLSGGCLGALPGTSTPLAAALLVVLALRKRRSG
jgi:DNA-binding beta-propeller fold protein YncE